jgi:hypothetical protein
MGKSELRLDTGECTTRLWFEKEQEQKDALSHS